MTVLESTGAATFTVGSAVQGAYAVVVSAEGTIYDTSTGEQSSFHKDFGNHTGRPTITCTREATEGPLRAVETFVLALSPAR